MTPERRAQIAYGLFVAHQEFMAQLGAQLKLHHNIVASEIGAERYRALIDELDYLQWSALDFACYQAVPVESEYREIMGTAIRIWVDSAKSGNDAQAYIETLDARLVAYSQHLRHFNEGPQSLWGLTSEFSRLASGRGGLGLGVVAAATWTTNYTSWGSFIKEASAE